jgi:hypothetical protein
LKSRPNLLPRLVGITAISAILILTIGILPPPQNENNITFSNVKGYDNIEDAPDFDIDNLQEIEFSIIESERVFTESDQSLVEQYLDENDLPSSSEKFGIEVQTVLFDSDQTQYPSSSILTIPALELTDSEGRLLDLGSIQTSFLGILSDSNRGSETSLNLEGTVKFYLDDTLITTKKLYASEQGDSRTYDLSIVDSLSSFDRSQAFTFTLSDEGQGWIDGSEHIYRVVITDIDVEINSNKDIEQYTWNGEKIAYELKVTLDESKKVLLGENNEALSIFKNDSTIQVCGVSKYFQFAYGKTGTIKSNNPSVVVREAVASDNYFAETGSNLSIKGTDNPNLSCNKKHCYGSTATTYCSAVTSGIPRDTDIVIDVKRDGETKSYEIHTPKSQINYYVEQKASEHAKYVCNMWSSQHSGCDKPAIAFYDIFEVFSSNFGYNSDDTIWDNSVVRTKP